MRKRMAYEGRFEDALGAHVTVVFEILGQEYPVYGRLMKLNINGNVLYCIHSDNPRDYPWPIDDNATLYNGIPERRGEMIGVAISE